MSIAALYLALTLGQAADPAWSEERTWAFNPGPDAFSAKALVDLRSLNEKEAGESGFVKLDGKGGFALGSGQPVRFWAVNSGVGREKPWGKRPLGRDSEPDLARHARFLAKRGVNMVRFHGQISPDPENPQAKLTDINISERDWAWRQIAAMKKEGIYVTLSPYWGVPFKIRADWGVAGGSHDNALALLFFEPKLQAAYKEWMRQLLTVNNPYTGIPLAKDPALAILQIQNEDSLFFWTVNNLQGEARSLLRRQYAAWLNKKYGSLDKARASWQNHAVEGDGRELPEFANIWEMTQARTGGFAARLADQAQFWAETQAAFHKEIHRFLREDLGCRQLVNAGNWKTANSSRLGDIERWTYLPNEVDAVNRYFDSLHKGANNGWAVVNGDQYASPSALRDPRGLPINLKQTENRPMLVTESSWVLPQGYTAEGPFLISAYQSLTGVDAYYWFALGDDEWTRPESANGYMPSSQKWNASTPELMGGFPAAAFLFRKGLLKQAEPVIVEAKSDRDLWDRRTAMIAEEASFDPNRDTGDLAPRLSIKTKASAYSWLAGPVHLRFGSDAAESKMADLSKLIDEKAGVYRSATGQVGMNTTDQYCVVDSPMAQGVTAFFGRRSHFPLTDITFLSKNEYGAALAVSLDGQPIKTSKKILVQYTTRSRPTGWKEKPVLIKSESGGDVAGFEISDFGRAPWRVQEADMVVAVRNSGLKKATELDPSLMPKSGVTLRTNAAGEKTFEFPKQALYVVLEG